MSGPATQPPVLATVRVRMYQVGFGDCFLLRFEYAGQAEPARHILIDFGTRQRAAGLDLADVAGEIDARTGGGPDVVVLSHRHQDHMSGYGGSGTDAPDGLVLSRLLGRLHRAQDLLRLGFDVLASDRHQNTPSSLTSTVTGIAA